jgi:GNAT superfamily N-acetyltransferase
MSNTWYARVRTISGSGVRVLAIRNGQHDDGAILDLNEADTGATLTEGCYLQALLDAEGRVVRLVPEPPAVSRPPLWFVEIRETTAQPPAVNLVAFSGHGQPEGAVLDATAATNLAISSADQLGAVRWWPATGEVDQIYVAPDWRRHRIGTRLVLSAGCLSIARNWPRLWGDGQRTALGEQFRNASTWRDRAADLTHVVPPMTPPA